MKFYAVSDGNNVRMAAKKADAHLLAKSHLFQRAFVEIQEVEIPADKETLAMLVEWHYAYKDPTEPSVEITKRGKKWQLTDRGGLVEATE